MQLARGAREPRQALTCSAAQLGHDYCLALGTSSGGPTSNGLRVLLLPLHTRVAPGGALALLRLSGCQPRRELYFRLRGFALDTLPHAPHAAHALVALALALLIPKLPHPGRER